MNIQPLRTALLFVTLATLARAQQPAGSILIRADGRESVLSAETLRALPRHDARVVAEGSADSVTVSGISLWDILQKVGVPPTEASGRQRAVMYVKLAGADGQGAVAALVEVDPGFSRRVFLIADQRNGQPLNAVEGPWRVIIPDDQRHARWIRGLVAISVSTVAAP